MSKLQNPVFVSYSRKDSEKANELVKNLSDRNIAFWIDQNISIGEQWESKIEQALDEASMYILLVSPEFAASNWFNYEIGYAIARSRITGAPIVPIIIEGGIIPNYLNKFQMLDARKMNMDEVAKKIQHILFQSSQSDSTALVRAA